MWRSAMSSNSPMHASVSSIQYFSIMPSRLRSPTWQAPIRGIEVALLVAARPHVGEDEVDNIVARLAAVPNFDRRNAQALGIDFGRVRIVAGRYRPPISVK